ncbi:RNA-binding protein Musashi [Marchantia polymorpha subsp. ruderalis]|uniref:RRM domain-containing protein n=2 Tax=Marchantia polymorpha TaxID=3197 RepID=A0A176W9Z5_MARPO|nr:hypothetical protein Mapa_014270 [Marchantia paleacea]OAE29195.1 hypothetical protein AXG93_2789s1050 [Marchantia polymorpha subsp. ruderalis]PTQ37069.1 hypothetical protein MARPO_0059s0021 [Marchantia polymorpha]BBN14650.1 hypothetical protein Mp_6g13280 [Marchantia polymorpha subsp. ruderalis]|eukprot:PTQ37069.1 hypothetical protein MARPO_0059s0021 [Marchantia polymorpha]
MSLGSRKLVVLGIPWDVDTEGLRQYMMKFGQLDDIIVMKDRATGRSRGFGYVTFTLTEDAEKALATQHSLNGRMLEVKIATPKEDMKPATKKITRVFVARIPPSVTDEMFRSYFEKYGTLTDAYMPKDQNSKAHRGIGFVTYEHADAVDKLMAESHELGGSTIAVDRATPKGAFAAPMEPGYELEETMKVWGRGFPAAAYATAPYGVYTNAARFTAFGGAAFGPYDYSGAGLGSDLGAAGMAGSYGSNAWPPPPPPPPGSILGGQNVQVPGATPAANYGSAAAPVPPARGLGTKIFVGRLPPEATADDLRRYFSNFGRILDVYVPKDAKKVSHRGFGFVTFAEEGAAERVALRTHELLGHQIAVDRAAPQDDSGGGSGYFQNSVGGQGGSTGGAGGPLRGNNPGVAAGGFGGLPGSLDFNSGWGAYGGVGPIPTGDSGVPGGHRASRIEPRYRPY